MKKPRFEVPRHIEKRSGRIALFLGSVAAACYLLVKLGGDHIHFIEAMYTEPPKSGFPIYLDMTMAGVGFIQSYWWVIAICAILLTIVFYAVTKSGTIFTVLSILVWLAGIAAYVALWLPSRGLERAAGG